MIPLSHGLILSAMLFSIGLLAVLTRKNTLFLLMGLEIMLNAVGVAFVSAGSFHQQSDGQVMFILILTLAAAEVCVGLALLVRLRRRVPTLNIDEVSQLRG